MRFDALHVTPFMIFLLYTANEWLDESDERVEDAVWLEQCLTRLFDPGRVIVDLQVVLVNDASDLLYVFIVRLPIYIIRIGIHLLSEYDGRFNELLSDAAAAAGITGNSSLWSTLRDSLYSPMDFYKVVQIVYRLTQPTGLQQWITSKRTLLIERTSRRWRADKQNMTILHNEL